MALIVIENLTKKSVRIHDFSKVVLWHFQRNGIDWMQACGGKGRCTTCTVQILKGIENLGPKTPAEIKYEMQGQLKKNERLACQLKVRGDVSVAVPNEYKLPHLKYSD